MASKRISNYNITIGAGSYMKNLLIILSMLFVTNVFGYKTTKGPMTIGSTQKKPDVSAVLELFSTAKGFLPPRLTTLERDAIATPATGLEIFNTDLGSPEFYNGITWVQSGGTGTSFQITVVGHGRAIGCPLAPVYFDGADWIDAAANATATLATHVITKVIDIDTLEISQSGRFSCNAHGLAVGVHYFVGVAGGLANVPAPTFNNPVILTEDANTIHVMPYRASSTAAVTIGQVDTVFGRTGNVIALNSDYDGSQVDFTPTVSVLSTDVQAAIEEVDAKVLAVDFSGKADNTVTITGGEGIQGGGDLTANRTLGLDVNSLTTQGITITDTLVYWDGLNHRKTDLTDIFSLIDLSISDLNDVSVVGAAAGKILEHNGISWVVGDKTLNTDSQTAALVPFTPFSFYVATNTQAAIQEIEGALTLNLNAKAEETITLTAGNHLIGGGDLTSNRIFDVTPATIDITTLLNYNANSFIDMSTVAVDVSDFNDGLHVTSGIQNLDATFSLAIDIPSLSRETPANPASDILIFSTLTNKLGKTSVQDVITSAVGAFIAPVDTVNGKIGNVTLNTDEIPTTLTNVYVTPAEKTLITTNQTQLGINTPQIGTNVTNIGNNASAIGTNITNIGTNATNIGLNTTAIGNNASAIAGLATVASTGNYSDLLGKPILGTAAATAIGDYATAAQGTTADSATQPLDNISTLTNDAGYITAAAIPVTSVNAKTGVVVLSTTDIAEGTNLYYTEGRVTANASVAANTAARHDALTIGTANGLSLATQALSLDVVTGIANGAMIAADKTKLDGVEALADVTDTTNVDAAGATMNTDTSLVGNGYFIDEDNMISDDPTKAPSQQSVKAYVDTTVASAKAYKGGYNAATNVPDLDTTPIAGIVSGHVYDVTTSGTFFSIIVEMGDMLTAVQDSPTLESHWVVTNTNLTPASIKSSYESNADTNAFTNADESKLDGIEALATADQTNLEIKTAYELNANTNAFEDAEKTKLTGIETGATADQTNLEIKTAYELNANTNAFTDAEQTKLGGIEALATADQTDAEIKIAYENNVNTNAFTDAEKTLITTNQTNIGTNVTAIGINATAIGLNTTHRTTVTGNPHAVTKAEVGLGNVDNTSDADKPVSTAQGIANTADRARANHTGTQLAATISDFELAHDSLPADNPHSVTKTQVGLSNLLNESNQKGYLQYAADVITTTNSVTFSDISLGTDRESFANGLFTKVNATDFRADFTGIASINYQAEIVTGTNDRGASIRVAKNGVSVPQSEALGVYVGKAAANRNGELSGNFKVTVTNGDIFKLQLASPEGAQMTINPNKALMEVEVYRITP
jgi:hypothetical protein